MRILLTGGSGFLGQQLLKKISEKEVTCYQIVRKVSGVPNEILWDFASPLTHLPEVDAIIHLAFSAIDTVDENQVFCNLIPATHIAMYANSKKIPVYFTSSIGVHGNEQLITPNTPIKPQNAYSRAKYIAEEIFKTICPDSVIFRVAGIYGIGGPKHLGLNAAITSAKNNLQSPSLFGNGEGLRNYISVDSVAEWILHAVQNRSSINCIEYIAGKEIMSLHQWLDSIRQIYTPNEKINFFEGKSSRHQIVQPSEPPVKLITFKEYLKLL